MEGRAGKTVRRRGLNCSSGLDLKEVAFLALCHCAMGSRAERGP